MLHRYQSRQRSYTELCNRSSSRSCEMGHGGNWMPYSCDAFEDYWEDASVSLGSCHSWDAPLSPWLGATTSACAKTEEAEENKRFSGLVSHQRRPYRYTFDDKGGRSFPPPLASCSTLSIKEGGRFVLKEMDADRPQGFFRAQRGNGRLRLRLVLPDEVLDEEDVSAESPSPVEDMTESKGESVMGFGHAHDEEAITSNQEDCSTCDEEGRSVSSDGNEGPFGRWDICASENFDTGRLNVQDVGSEGIECSVCSTLCHSEVIESNVCSTSCDVGMDVGCASLDVSLVQRVGMENAILEGETMPALDGFYSSDPCLDLLVCEKEVVFLETDNFVAFGKRGLDGLVVESSKESVVEEPLWSVDVSNQALASLSPWSPKQLCLHQPIVSMRPAFGLAMS